MIGDVNGDGRDDAVLVRQNATTGHFTWYVGYSSADGTIAGDGFDSIGFGGTPWGGALEDCFVADINGDGKADIGSRRRATNQIVAYFTEADGSWDATATVDENFNFGLSDDQMLWGDFNVVPEPATLGMLAIGGISLWFRRKFRR